ncbi:IS630 transposase-related protein [Holospora obtusa]
MLDLRERVIEYIKLGNNQNTTSKIFKVNNSSYVAPFKI